MSTLAIDGLPGQDAAAQRQMVQTELQIAAAEGKPSSAPSPVQKALLELVTAQAPRSVTPEAVARHVGGEAGRRRLPEVRAEAVRLAKDGRLVILRHSRPVDPTDFKGVYRLGLPDAGG
jgi:hypothetical protein